MYKDRSSVTVKYSQAPRVVERFFYRVRPYKNPLNIDKKGDFNGLVVSGALVKIGGMGAQEELWCLKPPADSERGKGRLCHIVNANEKASIDISQYLGYRNGSAVVISVNSGEEIIADLNFDVIDSATNKCRIWTIIGDVKYYLCHNAPDVEWKENGQQGDDESSWGFERLIKIKGIPHDPDTPNTPDTPDFDYFSENCGCTDKDTMPDSWQTGIEKLYRLVYKTDRVKAFYNLYGARYNITQNDIGHNNHRFHPGVDMAHLENKHPPIYLPFDGHVEKVNDSYGAVTVKDNRTGFIYTFMHMTNICVSETNDVDKGTVIGNQGSRFAGSDDKIGSHLHVEVVKNKDYLTPIYNASFVKMEDSIPPYPAFNTLILDDEVANPDFDNMDEGRLEEGEQDSGSGSGSGTGSGSGSSSAATLQENRQRYYNMVRDILPECGTTTESFYARMQQAAAENMNDPYVYSRFKKTIEDGYEQRVKNKYGLDDTWDDEDIAFFLRYDLMMEAESGE